jgi:signal transduction histidine kinase
MVHTIVHTGSQLRGGGKASSQKNSRAVHPETPGTGEAKQTFSKLVLVLGLIVALIGLGGIAGHFFELSWLRSFYGDSLSSIAIGLLFLGIALMTVLDTGLYHEKPRWIQPVRYGSLLISGGIGIYFTLWYLAVAHFNLLNLFVQNTPGYPGTPSFISAFNLLLSAALLYIFMIRQRSEAAVVYFIGVPAIFAWNLSLFALFGYYYDLPVLYNFSMTLPDALTYFMASLAILLGTIPYQGLLSPLVSSIPKVRWTGYAAIALGLFVLVYGVNAIAHLIEPRRILEELTYRRSYVSFLLATMAVGMLTKTLGLRGAQYFNNAASQVAQQAQGIEREMAVRQMLQAVRSSLNLTEIFESIVNELGMNLDADRCFITRYQSDSKQLSPPCREYLSSDEFPTMIGTQQQLSKAPEWLEQLVAQAKPIDFDPDTPGFYPEITAYLKEIQVQSGIGCAITHQGDGLAILFLHQCREKRTWTADEKKLIQTAAGQLGVAIHQANRYEASQVQARQQKGVAELSQRGLMGVDLTILIDQAVELLAETLKMDFGKVLEFLPKQNAFRLASGHGLKQGLARHATIDAGLDSQAGYTLASHKAVVVNNFESETRFTGMPFLQDHQVMSGMTVTIYGYAHEKPYGVLGIHAKEPRWFSEDDIHFVEAIANVLGMAIERKRIEGTLQISKEDAQMAQASAEVAQEKAEVLQARAEASQALAEAAKSIAEAAQKNAEAISLTLAKSEEMLKRYAAELELSNKDLEQFATIASHDLQAPLRKVKAFIEQLKLDEKDNLELESQDLLSRIQHSVKSMQALINDLLALSQISKGKPFAPVNLSNILIEVMADLSGQIREKQAQVEVGPLCPVTGDASQLRMLFNNLVENALKFQKPDVIPQVTISSDVSNEACTIQVKDNGIGFDPKYAQRIFSIFERLHGKSAYPGTGVGLAICRRIAERHGGSIEAVSKPGEGATFMIKLPVH